MFYIMAQVLIPRPPLQKKIALTINIHETLNNNVYFLDLLHTKNQKG